jgi:hypothetical protein
MTSLFPREEWESKYPALNTRYLAYCHHCNTTPEAWVSNVDFVSFINRCTAGFIAEKGIKSLRQVSDAEYTDWIWAHGGKYRE